MNNKTYHRALYLNTIKHYGKYDISSADDMNNKTYHRALYLNTIKHYGKYDINSAGEMKNKTSLQGPLLKYHKIHLFVDRRLGICLFFEHSNTSMNKLSSEMSNPSAFLTSTCLSKYVLNCTQLFSYFIFRFGLTV
jgi:hypothetical protein